MKIPLLEKNGWYFDLQIGFQPAEENVLYVQCEAKVNALVASRAIGEVDTIDILAIRLELHKLTSIISEKKARKSSK